ncbi:hypothetical protein [Tatumella citrea]|uniref:hypothetical protein n=1 Tax=Tatumella citrea TaxID=53336 RepID=UPI0012F74294|nr:hypothetical protein [Tatumella citrea]
MTGNPDGITAMDATGKGLAYGDKPLFIIGFGNRLIGQVREKAFIQNNEHAPPGEPYQAFCFLA